MNDFDIKKFLTENKMTRNSRLLSEGDVKKAIKYIRDFNENPTQSISADLTPNVLTALGYYDDNNPYGKAYKITVKHFENMLDSDAPPKGYDATLGIMPERKEVIKSLIKKLKKKGVKRIK